VEIYTGIDIIDVERFKDVLERQGQRFLKRVYTERELDSIPRGKEALYLCFSFSFKEAAWKALPVCMQKNCYFKNIEILWTGKGPEVLLKAGEKIKKITGFFEAGGKAVALIILVME